ncbi:hypothetical protein NUU61_002922 [Penicillium alfredii]|uniref:Chromatin SPT2 n=1 Tax=Penicillium alfredii TaxID=1506179 RepID=A0A9W9FT57_9EURO|nr:uncharacterized protein NUU61_002922 [Penicillium alfredii]KAJ5105575.1 hypothetical protein NUU61_002922 [Penicillium alfredii]
MSFLDSVLSSLQTGKPSQTSLSQPPAPPAPSSTTRKDVRKPETNSRAPVAGGNTSGMKRKAEDQLPRPSRPDAQPASKATGIRPAVSSATPKLARRPAENKTTPVFPKPAPRNGPSAGTKTAPAKAAPSKPAPVPSKPPPKGSFAEIMMKAKALQDKAPTQAGMLRHQAVPKEKLSKVERKKRMIEAQAKEKEARTGKKATPGTAPPGKPSPKKRDTEAPSYKGTAKPSQSLDMPAYRGTAGLPSKRGANDRQNGKRSRVNEYLGTDEEDEGDYGDYDDYYSDASSDMEAGLDDVENEEAVALKNAKREDEEELRQEMAAKQEKINRQKKLAALASRGKR